MVNTGNGGAWAVASVLVLLIVGALFVFGGNLFDGADGGGDTDVNVQRAESRSSGWWAGNPRCARRRASHTTGSLRCTGHAASSIRQHP